MKSRVISLLALLGTMLGSASIGSAAYLTVYGGPAYDPATGEGFPGAASAKVNESGLAVGRAMKYVAGIDKGERAVRWDPSTAPGTELGTLGTDSSGTAYVWANAINCAGTAVGFAEKYVDGNYQGALAVRWDLSGTAATELGHIGLSGAGTTYAEAYAINDAGVAVGYAKKYVDGSNKGLRAVRWAPSGAATELGDLGTASDGYSYCFAVALNASGTAAGVANKYVDGNYMGERAVRWDAAGTAATELGVLGTDSSGSTDARANAVNDPGTAVGWAEKWSGGYKGTRAVRWDAGGTAATELGVLGTDIVGGTGAMAYAMNDAGIAVGVVEKWVGGNSVGTRAVRWGPSGAAATELGDLGTDSSGFTHSAASAVNNAGTALGYARKYVNGSYAGARAVYWGMEGLAVDLNDLIDPANGWTLTQAYSMSDTGWIAGEGMFDGDGPGGYDPYNRLFLLQIPEPAALTLVALGGAVLLRRRRGFQPLTPRLA